MSKQKISTSTTQKTLKAERTTVLLGEISLEVFQMPDGQYRLSKAQILEIIGEKSYWLSRLQSGSPNILKELQGRGFTGCTVKAQVNLLRGSTRADTLSVSDAMRVWGRFSRSGNTIASDILEASGIEAIERRADAAFGIKRTEEEYNQRFSLRVDLKDIKRKMLVKAIAHWQHKQKIYGSKDGTKYFKAAHDRINLGLQNLSSQEIKSANNLPKSALIRDYFDSDVLINYSSISQIASNFLSDSTASNPVEAIDMAFACFLPKTYVAQPCQLVENINKVRQKLSKVKAQVC